VTATVAPAPASFRGWTVYTTALTWAIFLQAVTAGRLLSGDSWAREVHSTAGGLLFLAALVPAIVAGIRLRDVGGGRRLTLLLGGLAVALFVQDGLGKAAAAGDDTLWIHVPLGVAIVGFAAQATNHARKLATVTVPA